MEFVKDIVINDKYKTRVKIEKVRYPYGEIHVRASFFDNNSKDECFYTPILLEECMKDGSFDPKLAVTIASKLYLDYKKIKEKEEKRIAEFKLWNGVINIDRQ